MSDTEYTLCDQCRAREAEQDFIKPLYRNSKGEPVYWMATCEKCQRAWKVQD